jgi:excisionase family DNA binding protein
MPDNIPQLLPLLAVAETLSVSPHTVRSWVRNGRLRPIRLCRRLLFHPDEIRRFLDENSSNSKTTADARRSLESEAHCEHTTIRT